MLCYFNLVGVYFFGLIGEDFNGKFNNLLLFIIQVVIGKLFKLLVYGNDYDILDGFGIRDYIYVMDFVEGYFSILINLILGFCIYNLGIGVGYFVLYMIKEFECIMGKNILFDIVSCRSGDIVECWVSFELVYLELGWYVKRILVDMF